MLASNIRPKKKHWSRKTAKTTTYNAFYASKLQDYEEFFVGFMMQVLQGHIYCVFFLT